MKDILNCPQCGKPFHRTGTKQLLCTVCLEQELRMYEFCYQRLGRIVNQLDYRYVARYTNLDETRLKETLSYRLGVGGIDELPSWKRGSCNVCSHRLKNLDSAEPVCPSCLNSVVALVAKDERAILKNDLLDRRPAFSVGGPPVPETPGRNPVPRTDRGAGTAEAVVPKAQYDEVMEMLRRYRECFGELPPEVPQENPHEPPHENPQESAQEDSHEALSPLRAVSAVPLASNEVLMILDQKDEEVVFDEDEMTLLGNARLYAERMGPQMRHYGFKRGK